MQIPLYGKTMKQLLEAAKTGTFEEKVISDSFYVENDEGIILDKEKVVYEGEGHTFVQG